MELRARIKEARLPHDVRTATLPDIERLWFAFCPSWDVPSVLSTTVAQAAAQCIAADSKRKVPCLSTEALCTALVVPRDSLAYILMCRIHPNAPADQVENYELLILVFYLWHTEVLRPVPLLTGDPAVWAAHMASPAVHAEVLEHFRIFVGRFGSYTKAAFNYGGWIDVLDTGNVRYTCGSLERLLYDQFASNVARELRQTAVPEDYSRALFCF